MGAQKALVCGAGGFIGSHMVKRLKQEGYWVRGVDLKRPEFGPSMADHFVVGDLRDVGTWETVLDAGCDEVYQFAADMGGAGFVFSGENDAEIMHNSATINLHMAHFGVARKVKQVFYSSSACIYPAHNQQDPHNPNCAEETAYPAAPDSEYGWEKLFSERLYFSFLRNHGLNVRVARFHNIFGPEGTWTGGREKAPAALCRKIAEQPDGGQIELWGDGEQTRSFLYIDECIEGVRPLRQHFEALVTGDDVKNGKPDPAIFQKACTQLDCVPGTSLVIEDAASGVRGAKAAGMKCLGIACRERAPLLYAAGADWVQADFRAVKISAIVALFESQPQIHPETQPETEPVGTQPGALPFDRSDRSGRDRGGTRRTAGAKLEVHP